MWAGEMLRLFRSLAGKRQEDAAVALDISKTAVGHWENGRGLPSITQLYRLADLYQVDPLFMVDAMNYEGTKVAPAMRDWFRATHATSGAGIHAPRSSAAQSADDQVHSSATRANNRLFLGHHAIRTADQRYAAQLG